MLLIKIFHNILYLSMSSQTDSTKVETHVLAKYSIIKKVGSGAYGHVWKV